MTGRLLVSIVDDDESVRESLPDLLKEFGFAVEAFSSAEEFLASDHIGQTRCLILDMAMPGMSGPDLQQELRLRAQDIPIVFITGHLLIPSVYRGPTRFPLQEFTNLIGRA